MSLQDARQLVPKPQAGLVITQERFVTDDIISLFIERTKEDFSYLKPFIIEMGWEGEEDLPEIYQFVFEQIEYIDDTEAYGDDWQIIKSPGEVIHSGSADCKSLTLLLKAILDNLEKPVNHIVRFVWYKWHDYYKHVYLIAVLRNGLKRPMDTVYGTETGRNKYGREIKAIKSTKDYKFYPMPLAKLGTIETPNIFPSQVSEGELSLSLRKRELELINIANQNTDLDRDIEILEKAIEEKKASKELGCTSNYFLCPDIDNAFDKQKQPARVNQKLSECTLLMPNPHRFPPLYQNAPAYKAAVKEYEALLAKCKEDFAKQDVVIIENIEQASPALINLFSTDKIAKQEATQKAVELSKESGLSVDNITQTVRNGILKAALQQPEDLLASMPPATVLQIENTSADNLNSLVQTLKVPTTNLPPLDPVDKNGVENPPSSKKLGWLWLLLVPPVIWGVGKLIKN